MKPSGLARVPVNGAARKARRRERDHRIRTRVKALTRDPQSLRPMLLGVDGTIDLAVEIVRWSTHESVQKFVNAWDGLDVEAQQQVRVESLCEAVGLEPSVLYGEFSRLAYERGVDTAREIQGLGLITMMRASVEHASHPDAEGFRERQMHFQHTGLATATKGTSVKQQVLVHTGRMRPTDTAVTGLPPIINDQRALADRIRVEQDRLVEADSVPMNEDDNEDDDAE